MQHGGGVLRGVPKCEKPGMCLMEKIHVLGEPHSGMSYSTIEFNVDDSTIYVKLDFFIIKAHIKQD